MADTPPGDERLSVRLRALAEGARETDLTLADLMARLGGRVYTLLLVLLSLPFCQPLALPGVSTAFGAVVALPGIRFAFRQKPWLPPRLLRTPHPVRFLLKILEGSARLLGWLERFLHPRGVGMFDYRITQAVARTWHGAALSSSAFEILRGREFEDGGTPNRCDSFQSADGAGAIKGDLMPSDDEVRRRQLLDSFEAPFQLKHLPTRVAEEMMVMGLAGALISGRLPCNLHGNDPTVLRE